MSSTTSYTIQTVTNGEVADLDTRSKKQAAIDLANEYAAENEGVLVRVVTNAGNVVHEFAQTLVEGVSEAASTRTKPWSRTVEAGFDAPEVEGYTLAYTRNRISTGVYRANDKSGWLVLDTRSGEQTIVENTKQAREITNELSAQHLTETKAAAEKAKADAKVARDEAKAAKAEAKRVADEAKAAAKAEKEAAKVAKAAEAEAETETDEVDADNEA